MLVTNWGFEGLSLNQILKLRNIAKSWQLANFTTGLKEVLSPELECQHNTYTVHVHLT